MCELINCRIWEVLVLCGYCNVLIDQLPFMGIAGIGMRQLISCRKVEVLILCGYWNV
jgi:hypothetical protein